MDLAHYPSKDGIAVLECGMVVIAGGHVLRGTLVAAAAPLAVVVLHSLAALLPLGASMRAGRILGRAFHRLFRWRFSVLRENSHSVCAGADSLAALAYEHLGQALLLSLQPPWRTATLRRALRTEPTFVDFMQDVSAGGVIVSSGHLGVWELLPRLLAPDLPVQALRHARLVYRPLHNAFLDWWLRTWRRQTTCMCLVAADASLQNLRAALELGGIVGLLSDQRPSRPPWIEANFLGRQTLFSHGIAALHTRTGCPVWFATIKLQRTQDTAEGFVLHMHLSRLAPRKEASSDQSSRGGPDEHALVQAYADVLDSEIKETPYQYFWWHKRWRADADRC